jgi:hypothetical protein
MLNIFLFWKSLHLWDNVEKYGRATIGHMRIAWYITEATDTHSGYLILMFFTAKWLGESPSLLCSYILCLSCLLIPLTSWHTPVSMCIWTSKFRGNRMASSSSVEMIGKKYVTASPRNVCIKLTSDVTPYSRKTESLTRPPRKIKSWINIFFLKSILRLK